MSQSGLIIGPPSSFAASILRELIFTHARHSPVIALQDRETEGFALRAYYHQWAQARQFDPEDKPQLHTVHSTWQHGTVAALMDAIRDQLGPDILSAPKLLIVRDLSCHDAMDPKHYWLPLAKELSNETGANVLTAANWGGRPRIPVEEFATYQVDDLMRIENGWDLKITLHPIRPSGKPLIYKGTIASNGYYLFDLTEETVT